MSRIAGRGALAAAIALGLLLQARSLTVFFHHDDFERLEHLGAAVNPWQQLLERHVDHLPVVRNALYVAFLQLFGPTATPWHVLLLLLHAGNAAMLAGLLGRLECTPAARLFAVATFAGSTVFHECLYWVAASNVTLCLFFSLAALLAVLRAEGRCGWAWAVAAGVFGLLALLSATTAVVLVLLSPLIVFAVEGRPSLRRLAISVAAPSLALALLVLILLFNQPETAAGFAGTAGRSFDAVAGARLTLRSLVEQLAARYFTGGTLPWPMALLLTLALVVAAALRRRRAATSPALAVAAPVLWILASSFVVLSFRAWLGDAVFVSRYQMFPAVGFAWLVALAVDGLSEGGAPFLPFAARRLPAVVLGVVLPVVVAMNVYAHKVCHERWLARTEPLRRAHEEIAAGLRNVSAQARLRGEPVILRDHLVGGGTGYRPSLRAMSRYLLEPDDLAALRFSEDPRTPLPAPLLPLVEDLRQGRESWLAWLDDLSVADAPGDDVSRCQPVAAVTALFPSHEHVRLESAPDSSVRLEPVGQGRVPVLRTGPRDDIARWEAVCFSLQSDGPGEALLVFTGPDLPDVGRGARVRLGPGEKRKFVVDVELATRGRRERAREVELRLVNELTTYRLADLAVRHAPAQ